MSDKKYKQMSKEDKLPLKYACVQPDIKQHIWQALTSMGTPPAIMARTYRRSCIH